jgi:Flp pilus assembly pilin Flp
MEMLTMSAMARLLGDDAGNDLIEYALLAAVVGVAGAATLAIFPGVINDVYSSWDAATQDIWEPQDPQ